MDLCRNRGAREATPGDGKPVVAAKSVMFQAFVFFIPPAKGSPLLPDVSTYKCRSPDGTQKLR
jgi:hypothetical protein